MGYADEFAFNVCYVLHYYEYASGRVLDWTGVTVWKRSSMPFDFDSGYDEIWR